MTVPPVEEDVLTAAYDIATMAANFVADRYRQGDHPVEHKPDGSEVTAVDREAEQMVRQAVATRFPEDTVIGEEAGTSGGGGGRRWVVDPIDGTASFVRQVPLFSTLLAVVDEHGPAVGVVSLPALDEVVVAGRGRGCTHNGRTCKVSTVAELDAACVSSSAFDGSWWPRESLLGVLESGARTRTWGDGYGYFLVATGRIEAMVEPELATWDIAPMLTIIPEAGGRVTTWSGSSELAERAGWIASNGKVHDQLLALVGNSDL